jgi:predicted DNA-binding transcriptional regulator AlpA
MARTATSEDGGKPSIAKRKSVQPTLRTLSLPRLALRRDEAAATLGISPSTFDGWVRAGRMPQAVRVGGIALWDAEKVRSAWRDLQEAAESDALDDGPNPFDGVVV